MRAPVLLGPRRSPLAGSPPTSGAGSGHSRHWPRLCAPWVALVCGPFLLCSALCPGPYLDSLCSVLRAVFRGLFCTPSGRSPGPPACFGWASGCLGRSSFSGAPAGPFPHCWPLLGSLAYVTLVGPRLRFRPSLRPQAAAFDLTQSTDLNTNSKNPKK